MLPELGIPAEGRNSSRLMCLTSLESNRALEKNSAEIAQLAKGIKRDKKILHGGWTSCWNEYALNPRIEFAS